MDGAASSRAADIALRGDRNGVDRRFDRLLEAPAARCPACRTEIEQLRRPPARPSVLKRVHNLLRAWRRGAYAEIVQRAISRWRTQAGGVGV